MEWRLGLIGFGEAGATFARAAGWRAQVRVFDRKTDAAAEREGMLAAYASAGVQGAATLEQALADADMILSLVTADQALAVARAAAEHVRPGALYCDLNSVAPATKQAAARQIDAAGAHYSDVAVMAPVHPAGLNVPLRVSGPQAAAATEALIACGFTDVQGVGHEVGRASAIKMIRSIMVKGMEALTAECVLAAEAGGVREDVLASLDATEKALPWHRRADYNLDRMMVHGLRRAAEMEEVLKTLEDLGSEALMTRGTIAWQRRIGALGGKVPPDGLSAKIAFIAGGGACEAEAACE